MRIKQWAAFRCPYRRLATPERTSGLDRRVPQFRRRQSRPEHQGEAIASSVRRISCRGPFGSSERPRSNPRDFAKKSAVRPVTECIVSKSSQLNPHIENCRCRRHPCAIESEKHIPARQQNRGIAWKNRCQLLTGLLEGQIDEALIGIITVR